MDSLCIILLNEKVILLFMTLDRQLNQYAADTNDKTNQETTQETIQVIHDEKQDYYRTLTSLIPSISNFVHYVRDNTGKHITEEHVRNDTWNVREYRKSIFNRCPIIASLKISSNQLEITIKEEMNIRGLTVKKGDKINYVIGREGNINREDIYSSPSPNYDLNDAFPSTDILPAKVIEKYECYLADELRG